MWLQKFKKQWFQGLFTNLQIFNIPAGFATTQNPEESFNKQVKDNHRMLIVNFELIVYLKQMWKPSGFCISLGKVCSD